MRVAIDEARTGEARKLVQDGYEPIVENTRWCVFKRKGTLQQDELIAQQMRTVVHTFVNVPNSSDSPF